MEEEIGGCFLCSPRPDLVYMQCPDFYSMLGLGPIVEGYSVVSSRDHVPSMFDLDERLANEYRRFIQSVRDLLQKSYGPCIITEHGRVPACDFYDAGGREAHCYHAHQLVFPIDLDLAPVLHAKFGTRVASFGSFDDARLGTQPKVEYFYYQAADGSCKVVTQQVKFLRQFARMLVADALGCPERISWRDFPGLELIEAARMKLW